ncbi:MAG: hypothetical protein PVJ30_02305 [Thiohalocapsa sp.]
MKAFLTADFRSTATEQVRIGKYALVRLIDLQPAEPVPAMR